MHISYYQLFNRYMLVLFFYTIFVEFMNFLPTIKRHLSSHFHRFKQHLRGFQIYYISYHLLLSPIKSILTFMLCRKRKKKHRKLYLPWGLRIGTLTRPTLLNETTQVLRIFQNSNILPVDGDGKRPQPSGNNSV